VFLACPEVDDEIKNEQCVGDTVEHHPASAEIVVEERYGYRQNNKVG